MKEKSILVIGGSGYIGTALRVVLPKSINYDLKNNHSQNVLNNRILRKTIDRHNIDIIYNLCGPVLVSESILKPYYYWKTIVQGTLNVISACKAFHCRLIFASSKVVTQICPECKRLGSPYADAKAFAEQLIQSSLENYCILRFPNIYDDDGMDPYPSRLIPRLTLSAKSSGIVKIHPPSSTPITILNLRNLVQILISYMELDNSIIYNVPGTNTTIGELAQSIASTYAAKYIEEF